MPLQKDNAGNVYVPGWIDGRDVPQTNQRIFPVISATTGKTVHHAQSASAETAKAAVKSSAVAFQKWKRTPAANRRALLLRVADIYERRIEDAVKRQIDETSCADEFARFNILLATKILREIAANTAAIHGVIPSIDNPEVTSLVFKEPIGPVLAIPPWNSSLILSTRAVCTPIAAGCTVVMKSSELCPWTHRFIAESFEEAGLPAGVLNQIQASRDDAAAVTEALISHPAIRKIEFIGSANVGRIVATMAGKYLKPILLELGGKTPAIILDDADLEQAAQKCLMGAFIHHGQICFSTERIIVHRAIKDEFIKHLVAAGKNFTHAGTAVNAAGAQHAAEVVADAIRLGATFLIGGEAEVGPAALTPSILTDINPDSRIRDEETFGPSASLYVADDDDHAVRMANDSEYGLSATIHTADYERALRLAHELEYGQVHVNCLTVYDDVAAPVGCIKGSGWGSNNAGWGIEEFLINKHISLHQQSSGRHFGK